jgi:uncharacterized Rmd1/YagE family protein
MEKVRAVAWSVGNALPVKQLEGWPAPLATKPLTLAGKSGGFAVLFGFGAICALNLTKAEEEQLLQQTQVLVVGPRTRLISDVVEVVVAPGAEEGVDSAGQFVLAELSVGRVQVIAYVLAKSVVLGDYEGEVGEAFERIEPFASELKSSHSRHGSKAFLRELGNVLLIQSRMVGRAEISEKPEIAWEERHLDRLYEKLAIELELRDREQALVRKLELISSAASTYLDIMRGRQTLRVEWYIVILILFEILLTLYEFGTR